MNNEAFLYNRWRDNTKGIANIVVVTLRGIQVRVEDDQLNRIMIKLTLMIWSLEDRVENDQSLLMKRCVKLIKRLNRF